MPEVDVFKEINSIAPELKIEYRKRIAGGLSGAAVYLVDCQIDGELRLGVVKIDEPHKAQKELHGYELACSSWLKPLAPDKFLDLGTISDNKKVSLSTLAQDRIDDCRTLADVLEESFSYGKKQILFSLGYMYREQCASGVAEAKSYSLYDLFSGAIKDSLGDKWEDIWVGKGMPSSEYPTLVYQNNGERWPNPVAYLCKSDLWPEEKSKIKVPWAVSHGDLNPQNVLCPSVQRISTINSPLSSPAPLEIIKHVKLIDFPFCRTMPITYDLAFICSWLARKFFKFNNNSNTFQALKAFQAGMLTILSDNIQPDLSSDGERFCECVQVVFRQLKFSMPRMEEDIEASFLACLSAASLWQSIKNVKNEDLSTSNMALCLSSLALKALLGKDARNLQLPDFHFGNRTSVQEWTDKSRVISEKMDTLRKNKNLIIFIGQAFHQYLDLEDEVTQYKKYETSLQEYIQSYETKPAAEKMSRVGSIGNISPCAIIDYTIFPCIREAISSTINDYIKRVLPGDNKVDFFETDVMPYFHVRGSFEDITTVSIKAPEVSRSKAKLRETFIKYSKKLATRPHVIYVGVSFEEFKGANDYLQECWDNELKPVLVAENVDEKNKYIQEWQVEVLDGGVKEFLAACEDIVPVDRKKTDGDSGEYYIRVGDVARDSDGEQVISSGSFLNISVPIDSYRQISRASHLFTENDRETFRELSREPREFLLGHRIMFNEIQNSVLIVRDVYEEYITNVLSALSTRRPQIFIIPSLPGAGGSTALRWLAYNVAFKHSIPTLVLNKGGSVGFEAIERLYLLVGRSILVVADPQDVPIDDLRSIESRCAPSSYPVLFVTTQRVIRVSPTTVKILDIKLNDNERLSFIEKLNKYCASLDTRSLLNSKTKSIFLLLLEAFGCNHDKLKTFIANLMEEANDQQKYILACIAFYSRYAHRACSGAFLSLISTLEPADITDLLEPFDQLFVIFENGRWLCRHEELGGLILQHYFLGSVTQSSDSWRYMLSDFVCGLIKRCADTHSGSDIAADHIWCLVNPRLEGGASLHEGISRLLNGHDGIPEKAMRHRVLKEAVEAFPNDVNLLSHYGKFLSEEENKYSDAEFYLLRALELDPENEAINHMLGKSILDQIRDILKSYKPAIRPSEIQDNINLLAKQSHYWFDKARSIDLGSEYNYVTPIQLNILLIEDKLKSIGATSIVDCPEVFIQQNISNLFIVTQRLIDEGSRYISPYENQRKMFNVVKDKIHKLRGDLDKAILCFTEHVQRLSGSQKISAQIQLSQFHLERGEKLWMSGKHGKARKDFSAGEQYLYSVLQDPAHRFENIKLWFSCARYLNHWTREDYLERIHQLHEINPSLDSCFLLMCLYFADSVETGSTASWRKYGEFQIEASRRSANFAVRTFIREWLVEAQVTSGKEFRILPYKLFVKDDFADESSIKHVDDDSRVILKGIISNVHSSTVASIKLEPMGFELFFKPRVKDREFFKSDVGSKVSCFVAFTYEKPVAFDVKKIS